MKMNEERKKTLKRNALITIIELIILIIIALLLKNHQTINTNNETTINNTLQLDPNKTYFQTDELYYNLEELIDYAGSVLNISMNDEITEKDLCKCIRVGACTVIIKSDFPTNYTPEILKWCED